MPLDRNGLEILPRAECLRLLGSRPVGRLGVTRHALPAILPVAYRLVQETVVLATGTGSKSLAVGAGSVVAFEVDDFDEVGHRGWSVMVVGVARELGPNEPARAALGDAHSLAWANRYATHLIALSTEHLTGRRLDGMGGAE